jgi:hypothetical protein
MLKRTKNSCLRRAVPVRKMIESAVANAKYLRNVDADKLIIKDLRVDQGPMFRYYKPEQWTFDYSAKTAQSFACCFRKYDDKEV